jgi:mono/diheme cytochrome c family protein
MRRATIALALAGGLAACTPQAPRPTGEQITRAQASWPGVTSADVQHGRTLFLSHCSACHAAPNPASRAPDAWAAQVGKMAGRAHLSADDQRLITAYLRTASEH